MADERETEERVTIVDTEAAAEAAECWRWCCW